MITLFRIVCVGAALALPTGLAAAVERTTHNEVRNVNRRL